MPELNKAGRIDRRRADRPALNIPKKAEPHIEESEEGQTKYRPEAVIFALMVISLLIFAAIAI